MTDKKIQGDFTACDTALLNRFFRDYHAGHTRGGTNTKQRNLRHLFTWLEAEYDHPHPYTDQLSRSAPAAGRPSSAGGYAFRRRGRVVLVSAATARLSRTWAWPSAAVSSAGTAPGGCTPASTIPRGITTCTTIGTRYGNLTALRVYSSADLQLGALLSGLGG